MSNPGFAVWVTGLPASGKSTLARALARCLTESGLEIEILESDALRPILTPHPTYSEDERDAFYRAVAHAGALLTRHGVSVIFDATANRRRHRDRAREQIGRFLEVFVDCPLDVCTARDPKGIYRRARRGETETVPGPQSAYEKPQHPDLVVRGDREAPEAAAQRVLDRLRERGYLSTATA